MKLVVASTPKTGNTWLRFLLKEVYRLPMPELPFPFALDGIANADLPKSWVAQQHYFPTPEVLAWGKREQVVFLTTVRHPGDTLLSLYHYVRAYAGDPRWEGDPVGRMRCDVDVPASNVAAYAREDFPHYLELSLAWMRDGRSIIVRYEDLCRDADAALRRVVHAIHDCHPGSGLPLERVAGAVAACEIGMLREGLRLDPRFFRKGGSGGWADELPPDVLEVFRCRPPYPELFAALGYSADPASAERRAPRSPAAANPLQGAELFEDGIAVSPFLVRVYLSLDARSRRGMKPLAARSDPNSFVAWLSRPADDDPGSGASPTVTNLAAAIHAVRSDLQRVFPDPYGADRVRFVGWFLCNAGRDHGLDEALVSGTRPLARAE